MPAPHRRTHGPSLATKIGDNTAARALDDRSNLLASRTRAAKKFEEVSEALNRASESALLDGSDLARRAAEARARQVEVKRLTPEERREALHIANSQRASSAAFRRVLDTACPSHGAKPGEPCWWPLDHAALCGDRIRRAGYNGQVSARATYSRGGNR